MVVGFSGGEIKRWEVLKLFLQSPDFLLFDEPESGVDLEHIAAVGAAVNKLVSQPARDGSKRSATAVLIDHELRFAPSKIEGVEIMSIQDALMRYEWVQDLMFNLIAPDENELLRQSVELLNDPIGRFIYVHDGAKVQHPAQSFTVLETPQKRQFTHNITVIGKGADVEMISGAAAPDNVHAGHHVSIDETYLREGARCRSVSIER